MKRTILSVLAGTAVALLVSGCGSAEPESAAADAPSSVTPPQEEPGVTWSYLQSEYSQLLTSTDCEAGPLLMTCQGLRRSWIESMQRDVPELPASKARSDLLGQMESYIDANQEFSDKSCESDPAGIPGASCAVRTTLMNMAHSTIKTIVNREAAK